MGLLKVGDRVIQRGLVMLREADRFGEIVECYHGRSSAIDKGVPMVAVKWDDGSTERGYINGSGSLSVYTVCPTVVNGT